MHVLVHNEATSACCGQPVSNCQCGGSQLSPPPFVANVPAIKKPTPLGLPVMNFDEPEPEDSPRQVPATNGKKVTNSGIRVPEPLGLPVMRFD
jgi:hypothetical protein